MRRKGTVVGLAALVVLLVVGGVLAAWRPGDAGLIVGTVTTDLYPSPLAMDTRDGRAIIDGASNGPGAHLYVLDTRTARLVRVRSLPQQPMYFNLGAPLYDDQTARAFVVTQGNAVATLIAINARSGQSTQTSFTPPNNGQVNAVAVDGRSGRVFVLSTSGLSTYVSTFDAASLRLLGAETVSDSALLFGNLSTGTSGTPIVPDAGAGRVFVGHTESNSVGVLDATTGRLLRTTALHPRSNLVQGSYQTVSPILAARLGRVYVIDQKTGALTMLDAASGRLLGSTVTGPSAWPPVVVDEHDRRLYVFHPNGGVSLLDAISGRVLRTLSQPGGQWGSPVVDERTGRIFFDGAGGVMRVVDGANGRLLRTVSLGAGFVRYNHITVDESSGRVFVASAGFSPTTGQTRPMPVNGSVSVLDGYSGALLRTIRLDAAPDIVAVDARNHRALVFNMGGGTTGAPDPWGWIPSSARRRLPFLPRPRTRTAPGSVTVLDISKL